MSTGRVTQGHERRNDDDSTLRVAPATGEGEKNIVTDTTPAPRDELGENQGASRRHVFVVVTSRDNPDEKQTGSISQKAHGNGEQKKDPKIPTGESYRCNNFASLLSDLKNMKSHEEQKTLAQKWADNAERLLGEIDAEESYAQGKLSSLITEAKVQQLNTITIKGADLIHDLLKFILDCTHIAPCDIGEAAVQVLTVDEMSREFNVSTKTISRWRENRLVARKFLFGKHRRVGFLKSSINRYTQSNRERVQKGGRFSQLAENERESVIRQAKVLMQTGENPARIVGRIAKEMRRSIETIRYTLENYDASYPDEAVFPKHKQELSAEDRQRIFNLHRNGVTSKKLAKRYNRTEEGVKKIVHEFQFQRIMDIPLDYVPSDAFNKKGAKKEILGPLPAKPDKKVRKPPKGTPPYLASLYETPLLTREQEFHLFRQYNFLKYQACTMRAQMDPQRAKKKEMEQIESLHQQAQEVKNAIIRANLRLVVSIAKKYVTPHITLFELISDGNISLIKAAEKFDYARGNKFSTYATWAIRKNFARTFAVRCRHIDRFRSDYDEILTTLSDDRADPLAEELTQRDNVKLVERILACLDKREQQIIISRFGLDHSQEPQTLKEVGAGLGITKERVRQIEARALKKLRTASAEEPTEIDRYSGRPLRPHERSHMA